jgi:uncharacterized membrane protein
MKSEIQVVPPIKAFAAKKLVMIAWLLYLSGFIIPLSAIGSLVIGYIGKKDYAGMGYDDDFSKLIRTFWWSLGLSIVGIILAIVFVGYFILLGVTIFVVYRAISGLIKLNAFSGDS